VNVPNFLTSLRLAAIPVFVALFLSGRLGAALAVFVGAMITDLLDGIAARVLKQFTALGAILDPVADKLISLAVLVLLCWSRRLPRWLLGLLIFREICIFAAIAILTATGRTYVIRPTRFGKYATAFLAATMILALVQGARGVPGGPALIALSLVSAQCIFLSWAQYLATFIDLMRHRPQSAGA
jgi:cardiolipin synthase